MTEVKTKLGFVCFMLLQGNFVAALNCTQPTPESLFNALNNDTFTQNQIRPVKSFSDSVNVSVSFTLVGIIGVDEKTQTLTSVIWQVLQWDIEGLSWDEQECGTNRVSVLRENLWVPDVQISEFMDEDKSPKTPYVYLYNTGLVYDDKPVRVVSSCRLLIYTFPFDVQNCSLTFESYLHFAADVRVFPGLSAEKLLEESREVLQTNGEWELIDITLSQSMLVIRVGSYSEIKYFLILRRRPLPYVVNLLLPSSFLITVDLFSFLLPPQSDRSSFKMTLILGYTVFLLIMNDLLPITGETTPLINVYFSLSLALMVASLLETVFVMNIQSSSGQYSPVPNWLSVVVLRYLAFVVCLPPKKKSNRITVFLNQPTGELTTASSVSNTSVSELHSLPNSGPKIKSTEPALEELTKLSRDLMAIRLQVDKHFQGSKTSQEWQMIGAVIDRLLFGLYIVFIAVSFIIIMCIWLINDHHGA